MLIQVFHDCLLQCFDTAEGTATNAFFGDFCEEAFHLIQPGTARGNEVHLVTRMTL